LDFWVADYGQILERWYKSKMLMVDFPFTENPKPRDIHLYPVKTNLWKLIIISQLSDHHFNSMLYSPFLMVTSSFFISITKIIATGWYLYCIFHIFSSFPTFTIWVLKNDAVVFCFGPATNYSGRCVAKGLQRFASEEVV
jgi:hypothetical protein